MAAPAAPSGTPGTVSPRGFFVYGNWRKVMTAPLLENVNVQDEEILITPDRLKSAIR